jgi:hypothetical protein
MGLLSDFNVPGATLPNPENLKAPSINFGEVTPYGKLSEMSRTKLIRLYNDKASDGSPKSIMEMHLVLSELHRRDAEDREREMINNNRRMLWLTIFIAFLTLTNVSVAVLQAFEVI